MSNKINRSFFQNTMAAIAVVLGFVCSVSFSLAQDESVELRELRAALSIAQKDAAKAKVDAAKSEAQRKELVNSYAEAVRVSEEQFAANREVQLKLQAFGVDLFTMEDNSLERRLLNAVRDLDISHQEKEAQTRVMDMLASSYERFMEVVAKGKVSETAVAKAKESVEISKKAITLARNTGKNSNNGKSGLDNSRVVSIDSEIGLLVLNAGRAKGIKVGTPVAVLRGERPIFTAMIVDVRDTICGAVLQDKVGEAERVKVGDGVRILSSKLQ